MFMDYNYMLKIINKIKEICDDNDFIKDFNHVNQMACEDMPINIDELKEIANKYKEELNIIIDMENHTGVSFNSYFLNYWLEYAITLRNGLIKVFVYRKLKKDLNDNIKRNISEVNIITLYNLIENIK